MQIYEFFKFLPKKAAAATPLPCRHRHGGSSATESAAAAAPPWTFLFLFIYSKKNSKQAYRIFGAVIKFGSEFPIKGFKRVIRAEIHKGLINQIRIRKF